MTGAQANFLLSPYRVLDLTDERGLLCGKILADLGADVIQIEPPGGSSARDIGPFYHDEAHPEKSLFWWAYANNKRGVTLNLDTVDGRQLLQRLARGAHFLIESWPPGYLESLGLGYEALAAINPELIVVSITPFGQDGPYAHYKATDVTGMAMGGLMYLTGDPDRAPVRVGFPQFYLHGAAAGATGAMLAHSGAGGDWRGAARRCLLPTSSGAVSSPCAAILAVGKSGSQTAGVVSPERRGVKGARQLALQGRLRQFYAGRRRGRQRAERALALGLDARGGAA